MDVGYDTRNYSVVEIYDPCDASGGRIGCNSAGRGQVSSYRSDHLEHDHSFIRTGEVRIT